MKFYQTLKEGTFVVLYIWILQRRLIQSIMRSWMSKLSSVGVSPRSLQWFSSYLSNQKQPKPLVKINYPKLFPLLSGFRKEAS